LCARTSVLGRRLAGTDKGHYVRLTAVPARNALASRTGSTDQESRLEIFWRVHGGDFVIKRLDFRRYLADLEAFPGIGRVPPPYIVAIPCVTEQAAQSEEYKARY
jgi:hypothetical protein